MSSRTPYRARSVPRAVVDTTSSPSSGWMRSRSCHVLNNASVTALMSASEGTGAEEPRLLAVRGFAVEDRDEALAVNVN